MICKKALLSFVTLVTIVMGLSIPQLSIALEIKGDWIQGRMLIGSVEPGSKVSFLDRDVSVGEDGTFVFGLGRDAKPKAAITVTNPDGSSSTHEFKVEQRQYNIQRVNGVPQQTVDPPPEQIARINKESALTRKARRLDLPARHFLQEFQWPLLGPITGVYGSQRVYNGKPGTPHFGVDIAAPTGTVVRAPIDGVVSLAYDDMFYSGGTLIIDHGHGISSTFIHLSKILVKDGDEIKQGDPIAEVGATGRATGPHLDWRMNWFNYRIDPQLLVAPMPE
ncbi:M23 family metallopeptidase [Aurantivibrio infirmus]